MLHSTIQTKHIDLTEALQQHVDSRLEALGKFTRDVEAHAQVEIGKMTHHHQSGEGLYHSSIKLDLDGKQFIAKFVDADLYAAVDGMKDEIVREVKRSKGRKRDLFIRGARSIKKRIKGFKPWPKH